MGGSEPWLQSYVNEKYQNVPRQVNIRAKKRRLTIQCDETWSFVGNTGNKQWIWLVLDVETREIVGGYVGDSLKATLRERSHNGAQGLWDASPAVSRQCAVAYTDFWSAYDQVFPNKRHQSVGKDSGKTS